MTDQNRKPHAGAVVELHADRTAHHRASSPLYDADYGVYLDSEIDADLDGTWDSWSEPPGHQWSQSQSGPSGERPRVTHLVLVDGLPADHWVEESPDARWSRHGGPARPRGADPTAVDSFHRRELAWLDSVVGDRMALMSLDTAGLVTPLSLSLPPALSDPAQTARAEAIRAQATAHAATLFHDREMPAAAHYALEAVLRADPTCLSRTDRDDTATGAVLWVAGHANGLIGRQGDLYARDLWSRIQVSSSAASRGQAMLDRLRSASRRYALAWDDDPAHHPMPRLKATGHASLLTSTTRSLVVARRDAALAALRP
jgi:hypothetical protein